ncbi:hypothetical protein TELCIR_23647 [Teladorsagia circumcincta]|uniref:Uncharacterized protein n=1 Tax=Teladorsagia circumcincta TaxID=45464 RepID=A0A2G9TAH6_TELCI|nr:hypothetical protein TELCIR_23647 [Teladorsagia circumcincta]
MGCLKESRCIVACFVFLLDCFISIAFPP